MLFHYQKPKMICIHPNFKRDEFMFTDLEAKLPYHFAGKKGKEYKHLRFTGLGLPGELGSGLMNWFNEGKKSYDKKININQKEYEQQGWLLTRKLAAYLNLRYDVAFLFTGKKKKSQVITPNDNELSKAGTNTCWTMPLPNDSCDGKITLCLSKPDEGWIQLAILTAGLINAHVINCSDVFDPLPYFIDFMNDLTTLNQASLTLIINEEGSSSYITATSYCEKCIELIVETDHLIEGKYFLPVRTNLVYLKKKDLLSELLRRWEDWLKYDYDSENWNRMDPDDYNEEEMKHAKKWLPNNMDISALKAFLQSG